MERGFMDHRRNGLVEASGATQGAVAEGGFSRKEDRAMTLANRLTVGRILLVPLFVVVFFAGGYFAKWAAFFIAVAIEGSDILDGYFARRRGEVTELGTFLDPVADSFCRISVFICFAAYNLRSESFIAPVWRVENVHLIPAWMVIVLLLRDATLLFLRSAAVAKRLEINANPRFSGKAKAVLQGAAILLILLLLVLKEHYPSIPLVRIAYFLMLPVMVTTLWSLFDYVWSHRELFVHLDR
jgi:phosphatidylglycerophosphate synthase